MDISKLRRLAFVMEQIAVHGPCDRPWELRRGFEDAADSLGVRRLGEWLRLNGHADVAERINERIQAARQHVVEIARICEATPYDGDSSDWAEASDALLRVADRLLDTVAAVTGVVSDPEAAAVAEREAIASDLRKMAVASREVGDWKRGYIIRSLIGRRLMLLGDLGELPEDLLPAVGRQAMGEGWNVVNYALGIRWPDKATRPADAVARLAEDVAESLERLAAPQQAAGKTPPPGKLQPARWFNSKEAERGGWLLSPGQLDKAAQRGKVHRWRARDGEDWQYDVASVKANWPGKAIPDA